jgi:N-methylhydantoinase A
MTGSRIGVDVGGTFTDITFYDEGTGTVQVEKVPTTPGGPEAGVLAGLASPLTREWVSDAAYFIHGTTTGLNALIERRGARVGLLCTVGFRDVIELRRGDRPEMYSIFPAPPDPLVPRRLRLPVGERISAVGEVHLPLRREDIEDAYAAFVREDVECIAVAFINAYADPRHELEVERVLRQLGFEGGISLSHRLSREWHEYERTSTTLVDAYVRPKMSGYLDRLETGLRDQGFDGRALVARSGGGSMTFAEGAARPVETLMSGPVAGCQGAAELARELGLGDVITADVGGTSFDTALIVAGRTPLLFEGSVAGWPLRVPWVDVRSIGAGGGSIARVDAGGLLRVGPESAGANPGPACYGRGGREATVTDAAFWLGMLGNGSLASGLRLDRDLAEGALQPLADVLGIELEEVARGVLHIAGAAMANAIREITVEQGQDPRGMRLVAFGGAGPLFATLLARELGIARIVVPAHAGNFSAWGLLSADPTRVLARTFVEKLSDAALGHVDNIAEELFAELRNDVEDQGGVAVRELALDVRYVGQEHFLTIPLPAQGRPSSVGPNEVKRLFTEQYERSFGVLLDGEVEIVGVRATMRQPLSRRGMQRDHPRDGTRERLDAYSFTTGRMMAFDVVDIETLADGTAIAGPAIVTDATTTTYLDEQFVANVDPSGCLFIEDQPAEAR